MNQLTRERAGQLLAALGHPTRLRIIELLTEGPMTVTQIGEGLSLGQSTTSQNLAILTRAGALIVEPQGTSRYYRLRGPRLPAILLLIEDFCQTHELYGSVEGLTVHSDATITETVEQ